MPRPKTSPSSDAILRNLQRLRQRRAAVDRLIASLETYQALLESEMQALRGAPAKRPCRAEANCPRGNCAA